MNKWKKCILQLQNIKATRTKLRGRNIFLQLNFVGVYFISFFFSSDFFVFLLSWVVGVGGGGLFLFLRYYIHYCGACTLHRSCVHIYIYRLYVAQIVCAANWTIASGGACWYAGMQEVCKRESETAENHFDAYNVLACSACEGLVKVKLIFIFIFHFHLVASDS